MSALVLVSRDGAVTTLTLNRPEQRNALGAALLAALDEAIAAAEREAATRVLVLRGAGKVFSSGLDLAEASAPGGADAITGKFAAVLRRLAASRLVSIAAVHGAAIAGGAGLMGACDLAVAVRDTKLGFPELRRGIVPALLLPLLRRQVRERDVRELLLLGKLLDAERALAIGLVNRTVADLAALEIEVRSLASSVLQNAPDAIAETKHLLAEGWPGSLPAAWAEAEAHHRAHAATAEAREGVAAFQAKRAPGWAPRA
jgi:methylglutaconyl-CoA hydratase